MVFIESFSFEFYKLICKLKRLLPTLETDCEEICEYTWAHSQVGFLSITWRTFGYVCTEWEKIISECCVCFPNLLFLLRDGRGGDERYAAIMLPHGTDKEGCKPWKRVMTDTNCKSSLQL